MPEEWRSANMAKLEIYDCDQGGPEWIRCRLGLPTASNFGAILAKGRDGGASLTRKRYLRELAAEIISGEPAESYTNQFMERGKAQEAEARNLYADYNEVELDRVGFIRNGNKGASPDALIGKDGGLEIKTQLGHLQVELLMTDRFPSEHKAQIQGNLWVSERAWWDIAIYSRGLPLWVCRSYRDESFIGELAAAVDRFERELSEIVERVRAGKRPAFADQLRASLALSEEPHAS